MPELVGMQILHTWDDKDRLGWFERTVQGINLNKADRECAPTANFAVQYMKLLTTGAHKKKTIGKCDVMHEQDLW